MDSLDNYTENDLLELVQKQINRHKWIDISALLKEPEKIKDISKDDLDFVYYSLSKYTHGAAKKINSFNNHLKELGTENENNDYISLVVEFTSNVISNIERFESEIPLLDPEEAITILSIYNANTLDYEKASKAAINEIKKHTKEVFKDYTIADIKVSSLHEIDLNDFSEVDSMISFYTLQLTDRVFKVLYKALHPSKAAEHRKYMNEMEIKLDNYARVEKEIDLGDDKHESFKEILMEYHSFIEEMEKEIYQYKDSQTIVIDILKELFPGIKVENVGLPDSNNPLLAVPPTQYPRQFITPKDKVSNMLYDGELSEELTEIATESRTSNKELTAKVSIGFDELEGVSIKNKQITPYDREVHDSIVSLYVDGENEYITPLMVYRTMTGNQKAAITPKITKDISDSITKMSITRITIDATEEAKGYSLDKLIYEGNLIYTKRVVGEHKGNIGEWFYIMERPILYDYANAKNQVARMNINLLNTPVNKNEDTILLQGYLYRRILAMKGSDLSKSILYETIYKQLDIEDKADTVTRNKQRRVREQVQRILEYWKKEGFIKDYFDEPKGRVTYYRIRIDL